MGCGTPAAAPAPAPRPVARADEFARRDASIGPTILLSSGRYFDFTKPTPLTIEEVAHALSNICRFTGHSNQFYSVAQHSVLVSMLLPQPFKLWGLLHDAVEAVVGDMASPLKRLLPEYKALEDRVERVILASFGLDVDSKPPEVKQADLVALRTEQRDLMPASGGLWTSLQGIEPSLDFRIHPHGPEEARHGFLARYRMLVARAANDSSARAAA
jgi:hypothetical protein